MCVKPLTATTRPEIRVAASWISEASPRDRAAGGGPAQHGVERRAVDGRGEPVERVERHGGFGERLRRRRRRRRDRRASRRSPPRARPARSATARRAAASPGRTREARRSAASWASRQAATRPARAPACSASSSRSSSSAALRSIADAGLFSSCASPADSLPEREHLLVVQAARRELRGRDRASCARGST